MSSPQRQLHFNAFLMSSGHHEAAWRLPESNPFANTNLGHWRDLAQIAERATFDSVFLADGPAMPANPEFRPASALEPTPAYGLARPRDPDFPPARTVPHRVHGPDPAGALRAPPAGQPVHRDPAPRRAGTSRLTTGAARFARKGADRFGPETRWSPGPGDLPLLAGATTHLICATHAQLTVGDHELVVGRVEHAIIGSGEPPLLHHQGRFTRPEPGTPDDD